MVDDILLPYRQQVLNDEPVELFYGLTLYPVKMRDYITFNVCSSILKMNKNTTTVLIVIITHNWFLECWTISPQSTSFVVQCTN